MSARGFLITSPRSRPKILSESKRYIPLFWLSFLSSDDLEKAEHRGRYELDRKRAIERSSNSLAFFSMIFPQVASFGGIANSLLGKVKATRSRTIGIDIAELVADESDPFHRPLPTLETAIETIENRKTDYSRIVPARTIPNPFTGEDARIEERRFRSTQELLLSVCWLDADDLTARSKEVVRNTIIGYVWD
jgi:hypothetical protein